MKKNKHVLFGVLLTACGLPAFAQFAPGQVLTAAQLNSQFALYVPLAGGTLTGPLTVPTLTVTTALNTAHANITGGTISGLSTPISVPSGGLGAASLSGYLYGNGTSAVTAAATIPCIPASTNATCTVSTNAALQALSVAAFPVNSIIYRAGYATAGDGGAMFYRPSNAACSLAAGNGDNGSQVKSADGNCFLWQPAGQRVTPMVFGATGNGTADDTTPLQNALTATAGHTLYLGNNLYGISSTLTANGNIEGNGGGQGIYNATCTSGIRLLAGTFDAMSLGRAGIAIRNICMDIAGGVTSTKGGIVEIGAHNFLVVEKSQFNNVCKGIYLSGNGGTQNVGSRIVDNTIIPYNTAGCAAIVVGNVSTGASTVDAVLRGNQIYCGGAPNADGIQVYDAGGLMASQNTPYMCKYGTRIIPGTNQQTIWAYFNSTVLGDTSGTNDLLIDPSASSAVIHGLNFTDTWASSATGGDNVRIQDTGAVPVASYQGIRFVNHRTYIATTSSNGFTINATAEVAIKDSTICAAAANTGSGISLGATMQKVAIQNNTIGTCDQTSGSLATGITVPSGVDKLMITGNRLDTATAPLSLADSAAAAWVIRDNLGVDNITGNIASAASIVLPNNPIVNVTGTTAVTGMTARWSHRTLTLVPSTAGGVAFNTGGSTGPMCNSVTAAQFVSVSATWDSGFGCWLLK
ncbi:gp48 [Burkholderia phage Bcep43]|uniref:Gp48 n=1 Tax=Burkholderia phage Bcep43 TaxID=2883945 RepID=Q6UKA1_9CAUD|nr:tail fiber protein [Burkholderia phage Bcep43]AAR89341.2 gp48 [Burkholderia phage Bcep43]